MSRNDYSDQISKHIAAIVGDIVRTPPVKHVLSDVVKNLINGWAGTGWIRRKAAVPACWIVDKAFSTRENGSPRSISAGAGKLLTVFARKVNAGRSSDPDGQSVERGESVRSFLENTDFGELREMADVSVPHAVRSIEAFNEELWKYPAKVGAIVATLIPLLNMLVKVSTELMVPIKKAIGPDLLADILLSVIRGIDGADLAKLLSTVQEVIRRIHTGSLLLGTGGKPLFQVYLTDLLSDCITKMDPELVKKVRIILAEDSEAVSNALSEALSDNPDMILSYLSSAGQVKTSAVRNTLRRLGTIENLDSGMLDAAVSESVSNLDTYEIAGVINTACRIINRILDSRPEIMTGLVSGIVDSVDADELGETARRLAPGLAEAISPVARAVIPSLLTALSSLLRVDDGYANDEHAEALKNFRSALASGGGI